MSRIRAKDIDVIEMSHHVLQVRLWGQIFLLQMETEAYKTEFLRLLARLDGRHDSEALAAEVRLPPDEIRKILDALRNMSLTETVPDADDNAGAPPEAYLREHAAIFRVFECSKTKSTAECQRRVYAQRIAVVGDDPLAEELGRVLPAYGLVQTRRVDASAAADPAEIVVVPLSTYADVDTLEALNRRAVEERWTLMPITFDDGVARIGPTVVAGKTACVACLDLRTLSNIDNQEALGTYRSFVKAAGRRYPDVPSHVSAIAVFACHELLRIATAYDQAKSYNGVVKIDLWNGEVTRARVLKFPSCPVCSPRARRPKYDNHAFATMLAQL
jgi:bacteriocin biosynthesis cyclodehydratase domain-containing protein